MVVNKSVMLSQMVNTIILYMIWVVNKCYAITVSQMAGYKIRPKGGLNELYIDKWIKMG